ncbi:MULTISPECIES: single-stranded DNA-binding protein [Weeksella]|mgnify:CR=1 FL=1|uniref:Single-stranded DNA-binding protein n=1 Tax=Weeksella virosa (strain ATCC 43766 / DSM 16922 / JCM 21250 / CCUG 30538 / CDC 9751 / IAM 14551 / NBRC 16016 / NCTC 11634 / CL345/78) TaxID=865938 RepID=F0P2N0_WEEVC|nr:MULTISPECIES: single-stranded DNA-binding protein [Weeksella]ADX67869.1 single-strand binding protein [Weeksella virosa DSM 16922]MDK7674470.1 single-stranded DNA-binding protein [Weeksella virosa]OFM82836.1 single-stranded DNA-binding protein [Weeksella sp. HMSC059D05]SUP54172.1 Helix-destabilizing protein [Weeksella virosa]VEH64504.1 Helix-destabilizing protein [Weeksella virosa]
MNGTTNKVILIGNLGDDVKVHYFDDTNCIGRFPIATTEAYTSRAGERITETEWHNIVTRNKLAELCEKYLKKGDKVFVEGRIKTRKWDDNGQTRYTTEIVANSIEFLTPKSDHAQGTGTLPRSSSLDTKNVQEIEDEKDDLPF